jgi:hypothetical protein
MQTAMVFLLLNYKQAIVFEGEMQANFGNPVVISFAFLGLDISSRASSQA